MYLFIKQLSMFRSIITWYDWISIENDKILVGYVQFVHNGYPSDKNFMGDG